MAVRLSPRAAREHVRVARALGDLPLTHAAFARGELSYAKVRAITRVRWPGRAGGASLDDGAGDRVGNRAQARLRRLRRPQRTGSGCEHRLWLRGHRNPLDLGLAVEAMLHIARDA